MDHQTVAYITFVVLLLAAGLIAIVLHWSVRKSSKRHQHEIERLRERERVAKAWRSLVKGHKSHS